MVCVIHYDYIAFDGKLIRFQSVPANASLK